MTTKAIALHIHAHIVDIITIISHHELSLTSEWAVKLFKLLLLFCSISGGQSWSLEGFFVEILKQSRILKVKCSQNF